MTDEWMRRFHHEKEAPQDKHDWVRIYREGLLASVYCDYCGVTPKEWLDLQPIAVQP